MKQRKTSEAVKWTEVCLRVFRNKTALFAVSGNCFSLKLDTLIVLDAFYNSSKQKDLQ